MSQFPLKTFISVLNEKQIKQKNIQIFITQLQNHNILWIYSIVDTLKKVISATSSSSHIYSVNMKLNAVFMLQKFVFTCQYALIALLEVYLTNSLFQVAEYYTKNKEYHQNSKYFKEHNFPTVNKIQEMSHNYVVKCSKILYFLSFLKSKRTYETEQMLEQSLYMKYVNSINLNFVNDQNFRSEFQIYANRKKYIHGLQQFKTHSYFLTDFFMKLLENNIFQNQILDNSFIESSKFSLNFKLFFKEGDVYVTSEAIARCAQVLCYSQSFQVKRKSLNIIGEFVIWGDIEAVLMINFTDYVKTIVDHIGSFEKNFVNLNPGKIYPQILGQQTSKIKFLTQFLMYLQTWSEIFPTLDCILLQNANPSVQQQIFNQKSTSAIQNNSKYESKIKTWYKYLSETKNIKFPQNPFLSKSKIETQRNLIKNKQRNEKLVQNLFNQNKLTLKVITKEVNIMAQNLAKFHTFQTKQQIEQGMTTVNNFCQSFQTKLQKVQFSHAQNQKLDKVIEKGLVIKQIFKKVQTYYKRFKAGKITKNQFLLKCKSKIKNEYFFDGFQIQKISDTSVLDQSSILLKKSSLKHSLEINLKQSKNKAKKNANQNNQIKQKYMQKVSRMISRTNSQKDQSFLNISGVSGFRYSNNFSHSNNLNGTQNSIKSYGTLPLKSSNNLKQDFNNKNIQNDKNINQKKLVKKQNNSLHSNGKKLFIVSKLIQQANMQETTISKIKQKVAQNNWNSNKKQTFKSSPEKQPQKNIQFDAIKLTSNILLQQFSFVPHNGQKFPSVVQSKVLNQNQDYNLKKQEGLNFLQINPINGYQQNAFNSPQFGNTICKVNEQKNSRRRGGVGLAKKYVNLTHKLIPQKSIKLDIAKLQNCFLFKKELSQHKKFDQIINGMLKKQSEIFVSQILRIQYLITRQEQKIKLTIFLFPQTDLDMLRFKIQQVSNIYVQVDQNKLIQPNIQKSAYQLFNLKKNKQYSIQINGSVLKLPYKLPQMIFQAYNQKSYQQILQTNFYLPFFFIHFLDYPLVDLQQFQINLSMGDKIVTEQYQINQYILQNIEDILQYFPNLKKLKPQLLSSVFPALIKTNQKKDQTSFAGVALYRNKKLFFKLVFDIQRSQNNKKTRTTLRVQGSKNDDQAGYQAIQYFMSQIVIIFTKLSVTNQ